MISPLLADTQLKAVNYGCAVAMHAANTLTSCTTLRTCACWGLDAVHLLLGMHGLRAQVVLQLPSHNRQKGGGLHSLRPHSSRPLDGLLLSPARVGQLLSCLRHVAMTGEQASLVRPGLPAGLRRTASVRAAALLGAAWAWGRRCSCRYSCTLTSCYWGDHVCTLCEAQLPCSMQATALCHGHLCQHVTVLLRARACYLPTCIKRLQAFLQAGQVLLLWTAIVTRAHSQVSFHKIS